MELHLGDVVELKKPHPCGGNAWSIVRLGADIGLRCNKCQRRILLPRSTAERRIRRFLTRATPAEPPLDLDLPATSST